MNAKSKLKVRGLYKEAGIPEILAALKNGASNVKDFAVNTYKANPEAVNRGGIDLASILAMMGMGKVKDSLQGKKTSLLDYILYGGLGLAGAEAGQAIYRGNKLNKQLTDQVQAISADNAGQQAVNSEISKQLDAAENTNKDLKTQLQARLAELKKQKSDYEGKLQTQADKHKSELADQEKALRERADERSKASELLKQQVVEEEKARSSKIKDAALSKLTPSVIRDESNKTLNKALKPAQGVDLQNNPILSAQGLGI